MRNVTLYQFLLALLVLWLVINYLPGGEAIGAIILIAAIVETRNGGANLQSFLNWIENPTF